MGVRFKNLSLIQKDNFFNFLKVIKVDFKQGSKMSIFLFFKDNLVLVWDKFNVVILNLRDKISYEEEGRI